MPFPPSRHASIISSMPLQTVGKRRTVAQDVPVKRFRVSRACDQCRAERSKCDGNQPQCAPCFDSNRACTFTSNPKKRGLPPGYIRGIELALALICQQNPEIEGSFITRLGQENTVLLARDTKESNRLHKIWRKSKLCKELNRKLTGEQGEVDNEDPLSSGEDSDAPVEQDNSLPVVISGVSSINATQQSGSTRAAQSLPAAQNVMEFESLTHLPSNCWQLLEAYSTYTQCWLPISEKLDILKLSYSYPSNGLYLSPSMPDSASHAEMWSIMTLSSCQNIIGNDSGRDDHSMNTTHMYNTTKKLMPTELGKFQLGHAKALLNLALVNLRSSLYDAAWILVGAASRITSILEESARSPGSRYVHVVASCYVLDNLLALSMNRRPYVNRSDIERAGRVEEDGLEEWQPWVGELDAAVGRTSRLPTLALSSFNRLVDLVGILAVSGRSPDIRNDAARQLSEWKASLSPQLDFVKTDATSIPLTPPAVLLQLTHFATILRCAPSRAYLEKTLGMLEMCQKQIRPNKLPSIIPCLLHCVTQSTESLPLEQAMQARIHRIMENFTMTVHRAPELSRNIPTQSNHTHSGNHHSYTGPSQAATRAFQQEIEQSLPPQQRQQRHPSSLMEDLLPEMNSNQQLGTTNFSPNPISTDFTSPALDANDPSISGDLESFFDELASLHGAKKLQNQPQFMQNLGFAPEVSMADLLATQSGQFMPMHSTTFDTEHEGEPLQFPLSDYYDAG